MSTQQQQQQQPPVPHVPLLASVSQRGEILSFNSKVDPRLINGYVEKLQDGTLWAVKRPGYTSHTFLSGGGLGVFFWNGFIFAIANGLLYKDGVSLGGVNTAGGRYTFSSNSGSIPSFFMHNSSNMYYYNGTSGLVAVGSPPANGMYPGAAFLDGTMYVMTNPNRICGSAVNDLSTWNTLNNINAQMQPEAGVALFKQLSYVVALKKASTEGFYDNGNPTGSPLNRSEGTFLPFGCKNANTLQVIEDAALWVTSGSGVSVMLLENMRPKIVSTPPVERLLHQLNFTNCFSWSLRISGHRFYVLTEKDNNITIVYDLTTDEWFQWTTPTNNYLPFTGSTNNALDQCIVQHEDGSLWQVESTIFTDNLVSFPFECYTPSWDGGIQFPKTLNRMDIVADQASSGVLQVRVSDDDYKTWSNFRSIDLSKDKKALHDCGTFQKRAWHVKYLAPTGLRLKAIELTGLMLGDG